MFNFREAGTCIILTMRNKSRGERQTAKTRFFHQRDDESKTNPYLTFHDSNLKLPSHLPTKAPSTRIQLRMTKRDKIIQQLAKMQAKTHNMEAETDQSRPMHEVKAQPTQIVSSKLMRYHTRSPEEDSERKASFVIRKQKQKDEGIMGKTVHLSTRLEIRQDSKTKRNYLNQTNIEFGNKTMKRLVHKPKQQSQSISKPKVTPTKDLLFSAWQSMDMFALSDDLIQYTSETLQLASTSPLLTLQPNRFRKARLRSKR